MSRLRLCILAAACVGMLLFGAVPLFALPAVRDDEAACVDGWASLNEQLEWRGRVALRTDYAYVDTAVSGASPPEVTRGRQIAWIMDGQVYVLALESPDDLWDEANELFDPIVDQLET